MAQTLDERVTQVETKLDRCESRIGTLEAKVDSFSADLKTGFTQIGDRLTNFDKRLIEDKEKWGDTFRKIARAAVWVLLSIVAAAAGVNLYESLMGMLK